MLFVIFCLHCECIQVENGDQGNLRLPKGLHTLLYRTTIFSNNVFHIELSSFVAQA
jgi:hypothetical protein